MALRSGRVGIHPSQVDPITGMLLNGPTPGSISFEDLADAQISNPEVGQTLKYNGTGWENEFSSISPTTLAALQDVQITDPEDGDYLVYDEENSKWINSGEVPGPSYPDITVTIYGAVEDTISFTDAAGISHTEVFASGQSSKSVTFKINPSGSTSITFTSAVAKDPSNLSNDFTKTVSVTSATTTIYIMPNENVLYWYGYIGSNFEVCTSANGWTNFRPVTDPTYNLRTMRISASSGNDCAVGSKTKITPISKVILIAQGVASSGGVYGSLAVEASKSITLDVYDRAPISNTLAKFEWTPSLTDGYLVSVIGDSTRSYDITAFYYE